MVYILDNLLHITPAQLAQGTALVPPYRQERAAHYRFHNDRVQSIFAFLLLQYAVRREFHIDDLLYLDSSRGKPFISNMEHIHFNLSHCKLAVACALSDSPVGVDVQDRTLRHLSVAKKVCTEQELARLEQSPDPHSDFTRLWTRKESFGKFTGNGMIYAMKEQPLWEQSPEGTVMETVDFDGCALSYCAEKRLDLQRVTLADLLPVQDNLP